MLESKGFTFRADEPLRRQLDSLDMVVLVSELEVIFGFNIEDRDLVDANFLTIDTLATFVTRKQVASS